MVVDHDKRRVVWAGKGRRAETLEKFFDLLGPSGCEQIVLVLRVIARRAYGFHSHGALISMLFLCCGGIELAPPLPTRV